MQIETKFGIGDSVFALVLEWQDVDCPACGASGRIIGVDGDDYECPRCVGSKRTVDSPKWIVTRPAEVSYVEYVTGKQIHSTRYGFGLMEYSDEKDCFATSEEAQAEADRRNAECETSTS